MEPKTSETEKIRNPLEINELSYSLIFTEQAQNPSSKLQEDFFEVFSIEQAHSENEHLGLQNGKESRSCKSIIENQELESNQSLQQMNPLDTEIQDDINILVKTQRKPSALKRIPPLQIVRTDFSIPTPLIFHFNRARRKAAFITDETSLFDSAILLLFEKNSVMIFILFL